MGSLADQEAAAPMVERLLVRCDGCQAETTFDTNVTSSQCAFCGRDIVAARASKKVIRPHGLMPFTVDRATARQAVHDWVKSLWFSPGDLEEQYSTDDRLVGMYVPFYAFDADCHVTYSGARTRIADREWEPVSGTYEETFVDELKSSSSGLERELLERVYGWDLASLEPYEDHFLSGFRAESPRGRPTPAFAQAEHSMRERMERTILLQMGGEEQRLDKVAFESQHVSFRLLLLPLWVSSIRYRGRSYRVVVNGRSGDTFGDEPLSGWRVTAAVILILAVFVVAGLVYYGGAYL